MLPDVQQFVILDLPIQSTKMPLPAALSSLGSIQISASKMTLIYPGMNGFRLVLSSAGISLNTVFAACLMDRAMYMVFRSVRRTRIPTRVRRAVPNVRRAFRKHAHRHAENHHADCQSDA